MRNKDELNALKNEVNALNAKLAELSEEELKEVTGGWTYSDIEITLGMDGSTSERND